MVDSGEVEMAATGELVRFRVIPLESKEHDPPFLSEGGDLVSSNIRRSGKKKASRSIPARSRLMKSSPKSSLLSMAEMRRGSLRGKALRQSGLKGSDGKSFKGKKGVSGKGLKVVVGSGSVMRMGGEGCEGGEEVAGGLVVEMTNGDEGKSLLEGVRAGVDAGKVLVALSDPDGGAEEMAMEAGSGGVEGVCGKGVEGPAQGPMVVDKGALMVVNDLGMVVNVSDVALDLCEAQPLQNMEFLKANTGGFEGSKWAGQGVVTQLEFPPGGKFVEEDFPPLSDGASKRGKSGGVPQPQRPGKGDRSGRDGLEEVKGLSTNLQPGETAVRRQQAHPMGGLAGKGQRKTMVDILKAGDKDCFFRA